MDESQSRPVGRFLRPNREQVVLRSLDLEMLIGEDDRARHVWAYVSRMDLSAFRDEVKSVEGSAGRPAIDPAILLSVWLLAIVDGIGSSRRVAELCDKHHSYQWLCGGVSVEYRTLSNFRVRHGEKLERVLTHGLVILQDANLLQLESIAQDGMRIRASAGTSSFRRRKRLMELHDQALQRVRKLRQELEDDPGACSRRQAAARERAASDRVARLEHSLAEADKLLAHDEVRALRDGRLGKRKEAAKVKDSDGDSGTPAPASGSPPEPEPEPEGEAKLRVSTTDPEARVMKFPGGGYHPGFNAQFATDVATGVIVGVGQTNSGSDANQLKPVLDDIERRLGIHPSVVLADSGYCAKSDVEAVAALGAVLYSPPRLRKPAKRQRKRRDSPVVAEWRSRMATAEAREIYKKRAPAAEGTNANARNRGLYTLPVRGLRKVRSLLLLFAICHNMLRTWSLLPASKTATPQLA